MEVGRRNENEPLKKPVLVAVSEVLKGLHC
jgi:hypothetical protein